MLNTKTRLLLPALLLGFVVAGCNDRGEQARRASTGNAQHAASGQSAGNQQVDDNWITTSVQSKLFTDRAVKGSHIAVDTKDRVVTLKGTVPNQQAKQSALQQAQNVSGVSRVNDQLQVASGQSPAATSGHNDQNAQGQQANAQSPGQSAPQQQPQDDNTITTRIEAKYFTDPVVTSRDIAVQTSNGNVTLKGSVQNDAERQQAVTAAKSVPGVKSVNDQLQLNAQLQPASGSQLPAVAPVAPNATAAVGTSGGGSSSTAQPTDDVAVRTRIQSLFYENDAIRNNKIAVASSDGVVTLSGTVSDAATKQQAVQIASSVPGVRRVIDQLGVR